MATQEFESFTGKLDAPTEYEYFDGTLDGETPKPSGALRDLGKSLKVGVQKLPGMVTGLADFPIALATGARPFTSAADAVGEATGFQPGKWADETQRSDDYKAGQANVNKAWAGVDAVQKDESASKLDYAKKLLADAPEIAGEYLKNPMYTANQVVESAPGMIAGGVASKAIRGLGALAGKGISAEAAAAGAMGPVRQAVPGYVERAAGDKWVNPVVAGIGEGAVTAGSAMDQSTGEDQQKNALAALGAGAGTALIGVGAGRLANKIGLETSGTAMAKIGDGTLGNGLGATKRILGGAISEAAFQELPQSMQEAMWQNYADGKPIMQGVARQGVEGALAGAVMGAGANVFNSDKQATPPPEQPPVVPPVPPATPPQDPAQLGYNPTAGTHTVFPDGSVVLNSESSNGAQTVRDMQRANRLANVGQDVTDVEPNPIRDQVAQSAAQGGALSGAALVALDTGATQQITDQQTSEADQAAYDAHMAEQDTTDKPITHGPIAEAAMSDEDKRAVLYSNQPVVDGGQKYTGTKDGDILNGMGAPFATRFGAQRRARMEGSDWTIAPVFDGFVARLKDANVSNDSGVQPVPTTGSGQDGNQSPASVGSGSDDANGLGADTAGSQPSGVGRAGEQSGGVPASPVVGRAQGTPRATTATTNPQPTTLGTQTSAKAGPGFSAKDVPSVKNTTPAANDTKAEQAPVEATAAVESNAATTANVPRAGSAAVESGGVVDAKQSLAAAKQELGSYPVSQPAQPATPQDASAANRAKLKAKNTPTVKESSTVQPVSQPPKEPNGTQADKAQPQQTKQQEAPASAGVSKSILATKGPHFASGVSDFKAGKPRVLPSYFTKTTGKNPKDWYRGWDAANVEAPIIQQLPPSSPVKEYGAGFEPVGARAFTEGKPRVLPTELRGLKGGSIAQEWYHGWDSAKASAPKPEIVVDKAEMRPYRKPDGSVGYEAVPIVENKQDGQNDELDAEMRSYEAKPNPTYSGEPKSPIAPANTAPVATESVAKDDAKAALSEKEKAAKAKMFNALGKLAHLAGKNTRMNWTQEEEQQLLPIVIELFDGAMDLGAVKFKQAVAYVREFISTNLDQETADAIPFDTLTGAYISVAGRHKDKPVSAKKLVASFDNLAELENSADEADTQAKDTLNEPATNDAGVGGRNPGEVQGADGGRGTPAQQPDARPYPGDVEAGQSGDVEKPDAANADGTTGLRGAGGNVGAQEGTDAGGPAGDGRTGAGGKGNADAGARGGSAGSGRPSRSGKTGGRGKTGTVKAPETVSQANTGPGDFVLDDPLKIVGGGQVARFDKNKASIELRNRLTDEGRMPTREEQAVLAGYTGWGSFGQELFKGNWSRSEPKPGWEARDKWLRENLGQKEWEGLQTSIINANFTDPPTVLAMWDMVRKMGFTGGRTLEPSIGIGNFYGMMPVDMVGRSQRAGIELDPVTGSMAQMLYPNANIQIKGYEESKTPDNFYDLVIGNWPFFEHGPADRRYNRLSPTLHDYFFLKAIDQTRPGGLVVGITSKGTMDKKGLGARMEMARKAELVAAFRLPTGAFAEYAGTAVVTDIIILRKREAPIGIVANEGWIEVKEHDTKEGTKVFVNEYFHKNPTHVVGEIDFGHGTTSFQPGLIVHRPDNMMEQLKRIAGLVPDGAFKADQAGKHIAYVANHTSDRTNALIDTPQGLFVVRGEYLAPANEVQKYELKDEKKTAKRVAELKSLVEMRKLYGALIDSEHKGDPEAARAALAKAYEAFGTAHGQLSNSFGLSYLEKIDDPFYPSLAALEIETTGADGKKAYRPAAILSASTMRGAKSMENPSITDAFVLSRNESVNPTLARIAELSKSTPDEVKSKLLDTGAGFELPNGDFTPSDVYLSGNVRAKMRDARAALESGNTSMEGNIAALEKVMPADVPYYKIETQMGATWVPSSTYAEFVAHMLGLKSTDGIEVGFQAGSWKIDFDSSLNHRAEASSGFGSAFVKFKRLVRAAIANQTINVKRKDSDGNEYIHQEETKEVNGKIADMRMKFGEWLWGNPTRRAALESEYNEVRNAYATPRFDGSFLGFQGMALTLGRGPFQLRQHQVNAIWRAIVTRKSLNAHEVGTGKTFTMGGIAVESRRYGIAKKPMLFAHNANSKSVAAEIQMMYPSAKVLYVDNMSKENVKTRMMQIANDDWDVIVLPHSLIDSIGFKEETLMNMAQEELADLELAANEAADEDGVSISSDMWDNEEELAKLRSVTAKQLVKQRLKILTTIRKLAQQASKEGSVAFEDLGVDMLLVDEAHEFKKPPIATKMNMKGLQTSTSDRSIAMMFLTKYVRSMNNGANVHLFTGTPITNTMTEVFHMMRYMMQEEMKDASLADWDGWFGSFAREVDDVELTSTGEYEAVTRLQSFINVPELRRMIGQYMDVVFSDDMPEMKPREINGKTLADKTLTEAERGQLLNGRTENAQDRPYKKVVNESSDMSPEQAHVFAQVQGYANAWKKMTKKSRKEAMTAGAPESPIIHDGIAAKASFDVRLVDGIANAGKEGSDEMAPHENSKAARTIKNLLEIYRGNAQAGQVVFMSMGMAKTVSRREGPVGMKRSVTYPSFSTMQDMIERLVQAGIPREQIAAVDGGTSKDKRKEIADKMNTGEIRIVFGSTGSLGVGVNMQRNLRAMHHMDAPWMPGDLEQRNGRGHRQGNQWNTVLEYRYITDRLDGKRWQVLARKQRFITDFMKSKGDARVIEGDSSEGDSDILSTFAEAAGDPRVLIREKMKKGLEQLRSRERLHSLAQADAIRDMNSAGRDINSYGKQLEDLLASGSVELAGKLLDSQRGDGFRMNIDGKDYAARSEAVDVLHKFVADEVRIGDDKVVGTYGGVPLRIEWDKLSPEPTLYLKLGGMTFEGTAASINSLDYDLRAHRDKAEAKIIANMERAHQRMNHAKDVANEPFHLQDKLTKTAQQLADLEQDIAMNPVAPPYWLRNGAPIDTEVVRNGKTYTVTGHRWTDDGWFVMAQDEKGDTAIPYMEAMDPQGMPLYEERDFDAPTIAGQNARASAQINAPKAPKAVDVVVSDEATNISQTGAPEGNETDVVFSQGQQVPQAKRLTKQAVEKILEGVRARFPSLPPVLVENSVSDAFGSRVPAGTTAKGASNGKEVFVFLDSHSSELDVLRTIFHELFHHGLSKTLPQEQYISTMLKLLSDKQVSQYAKNWRESPEGVMRKGEMPVNNWHALSVEEALADIAEEINTGAKTGLRHSFMIRRIAAWAADLAEMLGLNKLATAIRGATLTEAQKYVQDMVKAAGEAGGSRQLRDARYSGVNRVTDMDAFEAWFKDSKVVDADGKPLVVYHGTGADFTEFRIPTGDADLGVHFGTSDQANIRASGGDSINVMPAYLSIKNPLRLEDGGDFFADEVYRQLEELGIEVGEGRGIQFLRDAIVAAGYDGVVYLNRREIPGLDDPYGDTTLGKSDAEVRKTYQDAQDSYIAFNPTQIKSAIGNNGQFDGTNPDIRFRLADTLTSAANSARDVNLPAGYKVGDLFNSVPGKLNWWHKTVGTQYNLAQRSKPFKRVYDAVQNFINDVSYFATEAADLAPNILPKLESWKDIAKSPLSAEDTKALSTPVFEGTLTWARDESGKPVKMAVLEDAAKKLTPEQKAQRLLRGDHISQNVLKMWQGLPIDQYESLIEGKYESDMLKAGIVFTPEELKSLFNLNDKQVSLYQEFRKSVDKSLTNLAVADMIRFGGKDVEPIRAQVLDTKTVGEAAEMLRDYLLSVAGDSDVLVDTANKMIDKGDKAQDLIDRGYAPLSRFGTYTLDVVDAEGERAYFGMFESAAEASKMRRKMEGLYPGSAITQGTVSEQAYKMFAGVSPETLELFGDMLGLESQGDSAASQAFQEYLKLAKSSRSAMKRLIQRKGIAGFSEDAGRVLAGFVYSNARQTASSLHMGEMTNAANDIDKTQGELKDAAVKLVDYIKTPQEEAQALRGLLFAQYIGGSVASAMVNMTQPLTMTFPWLSQYGGVSSAAKQMTAAMKDSGKKTTGDTKLDAALHRAEEDGTVSPQEVHQLMAQSQGRGALQSGDGTRTGDALAKANNALSKVSLAWGKLFGVAEQFNRRVTFIAAYRTAVAQGIANPDAFARKAISETQGVYNKGNKPSWARGAVGSTLFTFKQYSIAYVEMISRMAKAGKPGSQERAQGQKAALLALAVLFLLSGAGGMPGADDLDDLISGAMQSMGYNFDSKMKRKEFFVGLLGEGGAQFMERGVSGLPGVPIDVSGRMGLGNLIPGTGLFTKKADHTRDVAELAGPAGDFVKRGFDAAGKLITGDVGGAVNSVSPKAIQNLTQAYDMANRGMYRDAKGMKVLDTDGYDALVKSIGFQPNDVKRAQDANFEVTRMIGLNKLNETDIANRWAMGVFEKDASKIQDARDDLAEWNRSNPESPIRIDFKQIRSRVQKMNETKAQRIAKTAPREIRAAVRQELVNAQ